VKKIRANAKGDCGDKKNIYGQVTRELVPGTLQLFYMKGYGAVERVFTASTLGARRQRSSQGGQVHRPKAA
jgi:hypothetical protein